MFALVFCVVSVLGVGHVRDARVRLHGIAREELQTEITSEATKTPTVALDPLWLLAIFVGCILVAVLLAAVCSRGEDEHHEKFKLGQDEVDMRGCTDIPCLLLFVGWLVAVIALGIIVTRDGNSADLISGVDAEDNRCGAGDLAKKPYIWYASLSLDKPNGICVAACPALGETVLGTKGTKYTAELPTKLLAGRCVPYQPPPTKSGAIELCQVPRCVSDASSPCGPTSLGLGALTVLGGDLDAVAEAWKADGKTTTEVADLRSEVKASSECSVKATWAQVLQSEPELGHLSGLATSTTSWFFSFAESIWSQLDMVMLNGVWLTSLATLAWVALYPCCARLLLYGFALVLYCVFGLVDMLLLFKAGYLPAESSEWLSAICGHLNLPAEELLDLEGSWAWPAIIFTIFYLVLIFAAPWVKHRLDIAISLAKVASRAVMHRPSIISIPVICLVLFLVSVLPLLNLSIMSMSLGQSFYDKHKKTGAVFGESSNRGLSCFFAVSALLAANFVLGLLVASVASLTKNWYFHQDVRGCSFATIGKGCWRVVRFHLGTLFFGSCVLTICQVIAYITRWVEKKLQGSPADNGCLRCLTKAVMWAIYAVLAAVGFVTRYAYIYVGVCGSGFCTSARATSNLLAAWPVQVAVNEAANAAIQILMLTVPAGAGLVTYFELAGKQAEHPFEVSLFTAAVSYGVTQTGALLYVCAIDAIFVCAIRDMDSFDGQFMQTIPELRDLFAKGKGKSESSAKAGVEQPGPALA